MEIFLEFMLIKVKVKTEVKKYLVIKKAEDKFEVHVKEKPHAGLANQAVIQLLASYFNMSLNKIKIIRGQKTPNKIIEICC